MGMNARQDDLVVSGDLAVHPTAVMNSLRTHLNTACMLHTRSLRFIKMAWQNEKERRQRDLNFSSRTNRSTISSFNENRGEEYFSNGFFTVHSSHAMPTYKQWRHNFLDSMTTLQSK
jgi:hypothetical protein